MGKGLSNPSRSSMARRATAISSGLSVGGSMARMGSPGINFPMAKSMMEMAMITGISMIIRFTRYLNIDYLPAQWRPGPRHQCID
jgi:hypothetical protein